MSIFSTHSKLIFPPTILAGQNLPPAIVLPAKYPRSYYPQDPSLSDILQETATKYALFRPDCESEAMRIFRSAGQKPFNCECANPYRIAETITFRHPKSSQKEKIIHSISTYILAH